MVGVGRGGVGGSRGRTGRALNVKANSRSNKSDLIIIFLCVAVRAWLRLTRAGEPGQTPVKGAFIVHLKTLFGERKEGKEKKKTGVRTSEGRLQESFSEEADSWKLFGSWETFIYFVPKRLTANT